MNEWEYLEKKLREHEEHVATALTGGACKDFGEYQRICGVIHGLNLAKNEITDLRKKMEENETD